MRAWHIVKSRVRSIVFRDRRESDLSEELQIHLDRETERLQAAGLSREEARLEARRLFGGIEQIKEASRDARGTGAWDALARDTRHAGGAVTPGATRQVAPDAGAGVQVDRRQAHRSWRTQRPVARA